MSPETVGQGAKIFWEDSQVILGYSEKEVLWRKVISVQTKSILLSTRLKQGERESRKTGHNQIGVNDERQ